MPELIRFSFGNNSLGYFIVTVSGEGLVTFEFSSDRTVLLASLLARFLVSTNCHKFWA